MMDNWMEVKYKVSEGNFVFNIEFKGEGDKDSALFHLNNLIKITQNQIDCINDFHKRKL